MSFDAFIKIEGISGESLDEKHEDWIEIMGYGFGVDQSTSATASSAGGAGSGRARLADFFFTKHLDKASSKLFEFSCSGAHLKEVVLSLSRAGGDKLKYFEITLEEVIISSVTHLGESGVPFERIKLNYGRIKTTYTQQSRTTGAGGGKVVGGWDRIRNVVFA